MKFFPLRAWRQAVAEFLGIVAPQDSSQHRPESKRPEPRRCRFESLEVRQMLTGDNLHWNGGTSGAWNPSTSNTDWLLDDGVTATYWVNGDNAIFDATTSGTAVTVATGVSAGSLDFTKSGYTLSGGSLSLSGGISVSPSVAATIATPIVNPSLGTTSLDVSGGGTLALTGSSANTYTGGTLVSDSGTTLQLAKSGAVAIPHPGDSDLEIDVGAKVMLTGSGGNQIADATIVNNLGTLDLDGNNETIGIFEGTTDAVLNNSDSGTTAVLTVAANDFTGSGGTVTDGGGGVALLYVGNQLNSSLALGNFDEIQVAPGADGGDPSAGSVSPTGVDYASGSINLPISSLPADHIGAPWSPELTWSSQSSMVGDASNNIFGNNVATSSMPRLYQLNSTTIVLSDGANSDLFTLSGSIYTDFYHDTMVHDGTYDLYRLTDTTGTEQDFFDFSSGTSADLRGRIDQTWTPFGATMTFSYTSGQLASVTRSVTTIDSTTTTDVYGYSYTDGRVSSMTLVRNGSTTVATETFTYYDGTTDYGNAGDLESAIVTHFDGTADGVIDATYIRYQDGKQYVLTTDSYLRALASVSGSGVADVRGISDISQYATKVITYDGTQVQTIAIQGAGNTNDTNTGSGTFGVYSYEYGTSSFTPDGDFNVWVYSTSEELPNGSYNYVYSNFAGETLLVDQAAGGADWDTQTEYNSAGQVAVQVSPSDIASYSTSDPSLLALGTSDYTGTGNVVLTDYWSAGGSEPAGYVMDHVGNDGPLDYTTYSHSSGLIWVMASYTTYSVAGATVGGSTGAQVTDYDYSFYSGTAAIEEITTTSPGVTDEVSGTTTYDTSYVVLSPDGMGDPIWEKDAAGFLTYREFDPATGAMTKQIQDVDTSSLVSGSLEQLTHDETSASSWSSPTGSPLNIITSNDVDSLGRVTKAVDGNLNVTYTVYLDSQYEVRTYAGWITGADVPTAPTQVSRMDYVDNYFETFNMTAEPDVSGDVPTGAEDVADLTALTRSQMNDGGQVIETDVYYNINDTTGGTTYDLTYSTDSQQLSGATYTDNYYKTTIQYGSMGDVDRVVNPNGTIQRVVRDGLDRIASTWVGTNDSGWSPSSPGSYMSQLTANIYDYGRVGDSNLTMSIQFPSGGTTYASMAHVTEYTYDSRDRAYATKQGALVSFSTSSGSGESYYDASVTGMPSADSYIVNDLTGGGSESADSTTSRPITYDVLDNLGNVTAAYTYSGNGLLPTDLGSGGTPSSSSALFAMTGYNRDGEDRVYETLTYPVTGGTPGTAFTAQQITFDPRGLVVQTEDSLSDLTNYTFDGAGRELTVTTYPDGTDPSTETFGYDNNGNVTSVVDADGNATYYGFDAVNRNISMTDPLSVEATYTYDTAGNFSSSTDRDGHVIDYAHDNLGRVLTETWVNYYGTDENYVITTTYNANGIAATNDPDSAYSYTYNTLGQLNTIDNLGSASTGPKTPNAPDVVLTTNFDKLGEQTSLSATINSTNDFINGYTYDGLGQTTEITQSAPTTGDTWLPYKEFDFAYRADGQFSSITAKGGSAYSGHAIYTADFSYNDLNQISGLVYAGGTYDTTYETFGWTHDTEGNVLTASSNDGTATYTYDHTQQIASVAYSSDYVGGSLASSTVDYNFSPNGNPTGGSYSVSANQISTDGAYNYTYDANGNLKTKISTTDASDETDYTYDFRNRLVSVVNATAGTEVDYTYDMFNRMISRNDHVASTQYFVYYGNNMIYSLGGANQHRMLYGPAVDQILAADYQVNNSGGYGVVSFWMVNDNQGTVHDLLLTYSGSNVGVVDNISYDAWGNQVAETETLFSGVPDLDFHYAGGLGFAGKFDDPITGLQYNDNRWYMPSIERWATQDPTGLGPDGDPYRYCGNNPASEVDPSGLATTPGWVKDIFGDGAGLLGEPIQTPIPGGGSGEVGLGPNGNPGASGNMPFLGGEIQGSIGSGGGTFQYQSPNAQFSYDSNGERGSLLLPGDWQAWLQRDRSGNGSIIVTGPEWNFSANHNQNGSDGIVVNGPGWSLSANRDENGDEGITVQVPNGVQGSITHDRNGDAVAIQTPDADFWAQYGAGRYSYGLFWDLPNGDGYVGAGNQNGRDFFNFGFSIPGGTVGGGIEDGRVFFHGSAQLPGGGYVGVWVAPDGSWWVGAQRLW